MLKWDIEVERSLWADICVKSFWWFLVEAAGLPRLPRASRWFHPYIHKPIADWFQSHVEYWLAHRDDPEPKQVRIMLLVPREFGKSTLLTACGQLWLHLRDTELSTFTGSENKAQAVTFLSIIQAHLTGEEQASHFTWLYGNWYSPSRLWRQEYCVHAARRHTSRKDYSFGTWGVETGLTSKHIDARFFDDPTSYDRIMSDHAWIDKVNEHVSSLTPTLQADGLDVWVGTRYGDSDHFGNTLKKQGFCEIEGMNLPTQRPNDLGSWHVYYLKGHKLDGTPTFPEIWPESRMREWKNDDPLKFAAQVENDPASSDYNPITRAQIDECFVDDDAIPYDALRFSIHLDTAFKSLKRQAKGDWSVVELWGHHIGTGNVYYIEGYGSNKWRGEHFNKHVIALIQRCLAKNWPLFIITDEPEMGGHAGSWAQTLYADCAAAGIGRNIPLEVITRGGTRKEERIIHAAQYWVKGYVKLRRNAPGVYYLADQMAHLTPLPDPCDWADAGADVFHPKVYKPIRRIGSDEQPIVTHPWDEFLKVLPYNAEQIRKLYDESKREILGLTYEPV